MLAEILSITVIIVLVTVIITITTLNGKLSFELALITLLIPLIVTTISLILFYLSHFYKNRIFEWEFDKSFGTMSYQRVSPTFKKLRTYDLYDLAAVIYSKKYALNELYDWDYYVALLFKNKKKIIIYSEADFGGWFSKSDSKSAEEKCITFGKEIAEFLKLSFVYRRNFKLRIIIIFGILIIPLIASIFLMSFTLWGGIFSFIVFLGAIVLCAIGLTREYVKYKKNFEPI